MCCGSIYRMDFRVLLFYRSGGIVGSVTGCCMPSLLTNGGAFICTWYPIFGRSWLWCWRLSGVYRC